MSTKVSRKYTILETAVKMVRNIGFESVSIASLASEVGMSKSGLFAHFNSKEKMHVMILEHAANKFSNDVFAKSLKEEKGLPRLRLILQNWNKWYKGHSGGACPFIAASIEYDKKPGLVKDKLIEHTNQLISALELSISHCIEQGHFKEETQKSKVAFELYSLIIGHLVYLRTFEIKSSKQLFNQSLDELIERNTL